MVRRNSSPVFILAGGAGERLRPLTDARPKPAVPFAGTHQLIDFTLSNCINSGFRQIFVLTQHLREPLHDYIRRSHSRILAPAWGRGGDGLRLVPPVSGKRYRGTADAVFQNLPLIRGDSAENVLIASADHVYSMDYGPLLARHATSGADLTVLAIRWPAEEATAFGVLDVEDDGTVSAFREKPALESLPRQGEVLVSMGVYVFDRKALLDVADRATPMETDFGREILPRLIRARRVAAYDFGNADTNYWRDVGSLDSYYRANMEVVGPRPVFDPDRGCCWPTREGCETSIDRIDRTGNSRISKAASIEPCTIRRSVVSRDTYVERGAIIEDSVILPGARVGKNARVRNSIVTESALIPENARIGFNSIEDHRRYRVTPSGVIVVSRPSSLYATGGQSSRVEAVPQPGSGAQESQVETGGPMAHEFWRQVKAQ